MKVIDFFCGGGGFSEGFREAGFDVIFAVDMWSEAVFSHHANHSNATTIIDDVERISKLPYEEFEELVPDSEVIIGSPPCVAFSNSNKSGKADKSLGIRLIESYLRIVYRKKYKKNSVLKYWVMENVPNVEVFIKEQYSGSDLEINTIYNVDSDKILRVKNKSSTVYNAKYYGVPSNRKRYFCGEFPAPLQTKSDESIVPLGVVLDSLGKPAKDKKETKDVVVRDLFRNLKMKSSEVTDHHYYHHIPEFIWQKAKRAKLDKGYMGKMSFPENLNKPARTVMATMSLASRESMIFGDGKKFRAPTIREVATLMSFPLDYRFYGKSIESKYRMVGNSVPPMMSYAIAKRIMETENYEIQEYRPINFDSKIDFLNLNFTKVKEKVEKDKSPRAKFKYHLPYYKKKSYRVELSNYSSDFKANEFVWDAKIHKSQGQTARVFEPEVNKLIDYMCSSEVDRINQFIETYYRNSMMGLNGNLLQKKYCTSRLGSDDFTPDRLLLNVRDFILEFSHNELLEVEINQNELKVPKGIIIGYIILRELINRIGGEGERDTAS